MHKDGTEHTELASKLMDKAGEEILVAAKLHAVLPRLTDRQCADIVRDWGDEKKAN